MKQVLTLLVVSLTLAEIAVASGPGRASADFLSIVPDPRISALGGGLFGEASEMPAAAFSNPAGLAGASRSRLSLDYLVFAGDIRYQFASFVVPTAQGNVGGSVVYLNYGDIQGYDNDFQRIDVPGSSDLAVVLSYALPLRVTVPVYHEYGSLGLNFKFLQSRLSYYAAETVAIDLGGLYHIPFVNGLSVGASYTNIGTGFKFVKETGSLPTSLNVGFSYKKESLNNLLLALDFRSPQQGTPYLSAGVSVSPVYFLTLRAGWRHGFNRLFSTVGAGVGIELGDAALDYTFTPSPYLAPLHHVGVNVAIGNILNLEKASDHYMKRHFRAAQAYYHRGDYIEARQKFEEILSVYPDHVLSQQYLEKIIDAIERIEREKEQKIKKWLAIADDAMKKKDFVTAHAYLNRVRAYELDNAVALAGLREVEEKLNDIRLERARQQNSGKINELWKAGMRYYLKGDFVKAKRKFGEILAIDPENEKTREYLVEIDNQLAKVAVSKVNELFAQGMSLFREGNYLEAVKYFEAVTIASPNRIDAQEYIQKCQQIVQEQEDKQKAERIAREQEKMNSEMDEVYRRAVKLYDGGNYESALDQFVKGSEIANRYEFREYSDKIVTYIANIRAALAERYYKIGFAYFRKNKFEDAADAYRRALSYNPDHAPAKFELQRMKKDLGKKFYEAGMSYFGQNDTERAKEMFRKSLQYDPDRQESQRALERIK